MNDLEARVRLLELAAVVTKATNIYSAEGIVNFATELYTFTQAPMPKETSAEIVDKPKPKRSATKQADILS